ncbi:MAG: Co2+/Mg2+ efflux protein ApaG [Neisseria sp.]
MSDSDAIHIVVKPRYLAEQSNIIDDKYVFVYKIMIFNQSQDAITLRNRFWLITDAHGDEERVSGAGVIGQQPTLYPGDEFEYSSGAHLKTPWGTMEGHYEFEDERGGRFSIPIPQFDLKADITIQ